MSGVPVLMIASMTLKQWNQATRLPDLHIGDKFFSDPDLVPGLVSAGKATVAPAGTDPPRPYPRTVNGVPGLGAATTNSSP